MLIQRTLLCFMILLLSSVSVAQAADTFRMHSSSAQKTVPVAQADDMAPTRRHTSSHSPAGLYLGLLAGSTYPMDAENGSGRPAAGPLSPAESAFDPGYTVSALLGYDFAPVRRAHPANNVRLEAELGFNEADLDEGRGNPEIRVSTFLANLYYDLQTGTRWEPFVGGGVGGARYDADGANLSDDDDTVFAYQARAGMGYRLSPSTTATLGYRFFDTFDPELETRAGRAFETAYRSHSVEVGLRYTF